jgi:hypothetical protein
MDPVKAKANYSRVCQLLVDKGGEALRRALHAKHPPSTLAAVLNANKTTLKKIRYSVIKPSQWDLLFPVLGTPDSNNFDITLLTILLRNVCGLTSPAAGWGVIPAASDTSISADILRIKIFRNEVYGHIPTAQYDDTTFETLWQKISKPLIKLGIPQQDIDELKEAPLSPEEESYIEKLKEWKELEDDLLSKLKDLERGVLNVENEVLELRRIVENVVPSQVDQLAKFDFTGKIDRLCKKFQNGTREWFFDKLSSWLDDKESRVMILTAGPGAGKSVLSAKVCELYKQRGQLAGYHFCDFRNLDSRNPHKILQSLASQMCDNVAGFRGKLTEALRRDHSRELLSDAFRVILNNPLRALDRRAPVLIVVDALDESKTDAKSEFLELISEEFIELPEWIKIFITSRPELQVRKKLEDLNPVEILPDDPHHNLDLKHFIHHCLPNMNQGNVSSLISKCEGSFLYAYYSVNALKKMDLGIEPNLKDYVPKGISGFYEKQFGRLKTGLQSSIPDTWSSVFKSFLNVVAASREPLPMKVLVTCMGLGLSSEEYVMRETIMGIMSEILPFYDDCLTVYHKSLWDWLTLDGYEDHAFVANVADGTKRLWRACSNIYRSIDSLSSVLDFQISPEKKYALKNGGKYLLDVGVAEDFHWLVNVRLNFLKLKLFDSLNVGISGILKFYKVKRPNYHYWGNIHLHVFSEIMKQRRTGKTLWFYEESREIYYIYLQSLANGYFDFVQRTINCKNEARDILDKSNEMWVEEMGNDYNSNFKIISHAVMGNVEELLKQHNARALSQDNKLVADINERTVEVFELPSLIMVFDLEISELRGPSRFLTFSPDSLYLLWNSVRSCISIREQKEVPLIPLGPENVDCCSFSSCGMRLVTCEKNLIKMWDVKNKSMLVEFRTEIDVDYCLFSNCNSYVLARPVRQMKAFDFNDITILESTTLERIDIDNVSCSNTCLTNEYCYQIISPSYWDVLSSTAQFAIRHFHLPSDGIVLIANRCCSNPFTWKGRNCVIFFSSMHWASVYDFINYEVVQFFHINCLPNNTSVDCISNLDQTNWFVCLSHHQVFVLSLETPTETSVIRSVYTPDIRCYALSPDNLYVACCDKNRILEIKSVDNGKILQTVELKQPPEACWWSELYLWVVCKGVVVKYSYNSTQINVLGDEFEECAINFQCVLKFAKGVLVIRLSDNEEISLLKICKQILYPQQIPESNFNATSVAVSSDGCAVLLYRKSSSDYQLWEISSENKWDVRSSGRLHDFYKVSWFCLTDTENSRSSIWVTYMFTSFEDDLNEPLCISSIDFPSCKQGSWHELPLQHMITGVIYVDSNIVIIYKCGWIYFVNVFDGKIITSLDVGRLPGLRSVSCFYIASRGMLLLGGASGIKFIKIHSPSFVS